MSTEEHFQRPRVTVHVDHPNGDGPPIDTFWIDPVHGVPRVGDMIDTHHGVLEVRRVIWGISRTVEERFGRNLAWHTFDSDIRVDTVLVP